MAKLELYFNDLSFERQFSDVEELKKALIRLMDMRELAHNYRHRLYCHRNTPNSGVNEQGDNLLRAINRFQDKDRYRSLLSWMCQQGPFLEDLQERSGDEMLFCNRCNVTDAAVGEVARNVDLGIASAVISIEPSSWCWPSLEVEKEPHAPIVVQNFWEVGKLQSVLEGIQPSLSSWESLENVAQARFTSLIFAKDAFDYLRPHPFSPGAARRLLSLMKVLHDLKNEKDKPERPTPKEKNIIETYFSGNNTYFSNSSEGEKQDFRKELTFKHPKHPGKDVFCPWHGKFRFGSSPYRFHFFPYPLEKNKPVYVVYVGLKITKR